MTDSLKSTPTLLPNGSKLWEGALKNGLRVWMIEDHRTPVVSFHTWVAAGAAIERVDPKIQRTGIAHLFEHLMFRGTKKFKDGEFDRLLTQNGAYDSNATTWLDRTHYYQCVVKENIDVVFELERDRVTGLELSSDVFETERKAVLGEYQLGMDDPDTVGYEHLYFQAFQSHPYRYGTMGTEADIRSFTLEEAFYFYERYYSPGEMTLFLGGDFDPRQMFEKIQSVYGDLKNTSSTERKSIPEESMQTKETRFEFIHPQIEDSSLFIGYRVPGVQHSDQAALMVLQALLCQGQGAYLQKEWVDTGWVNALDGGVDRFRNSGLLTIGADLNTDIDPKPILSVLDELPRVLGQWTDEQWDFHLERARNYILLHEYDALTEVHELAAWMGEFWISGDDPCLGLKILEKVSRVNREDVLNMIQKYLPSENRTWVYGLPVEGEK